ncbi:TPA: hypothetical protein DIC20_00655 [Candidatus Dependentiae bacterium]|nr:hypothetical protein [Candidatus Dependentiae bacterium]HCU00196.1 hypothetical protein [Candidatus Dependentiae bacterium]
MNARALFKYSLLCALSFSQLSYGIITTLAKNDPVPPYTVDNPFALLGTRRYEYLKGRDQSDPNDKHMSIEIMPFYQRSNRGANSCGTQTELGDISGRWNMISLLPFNFQEPPGAGVYTNTNEDLPCGCEFPQILIDTRNDLIDEISHLATETIATPKELATVQGLLSLQQTNTALQANFGFFSVPMIYKKSGIRFNAQFYIGKGIGGDFQTGFAEIFQCATYTDETPNCKGSNNNPFNSETSGKSSDDPAWVTTATWNEICKSVSRILMANLDNILSSTQICQSNCTFREKSIEDLNGELFWRYPLEINKDQSPADYPKFLFIPFIAAGGTLAVSKCKDQCELLSLPFGNNGHNAFRVRGGFSFDFYETLQLNFEGGGTFFKSHKYCGYPVPNNSYQHPIYPFRTDILYCPGSNWHMVLGVYARNFFNQWSASFNYIYVSHQKDCIQLLCNNYAAGPESDPSTCRKNIYPFKPGVLECNSEWSVQVFDTSLTYNISPNFTLGVLIQIPVKRKNAYRSSTYMGSLYMSF